LGYPAKTVSLPGDGHIYIDGGLVKEPYLDDRIESMPVGSVPVGCVSPRDGALDCVLPPSAYFVLGDNRAASKDSRFFGPVERREIRGVLVED